MSLDKAIAHGHEHRKGYRERGKSGEYVLSCRPHGGCPYCQANRAFQAKRLQAETKEQMRDLHTISE